MTGRASRRTGRRTDPAAEARQQGWTEVRQHPLFAPLAIGSPTRADPAGLPAGFWARITANGLVEAHPTRPATPAEWSWVFAHLLLHLGFGHAWQVVRSGSTMDAAACAAAEVTVCRFLAGLKIGRPPNTLPALLPDGDEAGLAGGWRRGGVPAELAGLGVAGGLPDLVPSRGHWGDCDAAEDPWGPRFAAGLTAAATAAVELAGGLRATLTGGTPPVRAWDAARRWFITSYPLLGSVLSGLTLIADADLARRRGISVAAVDPAAGEIYVNPLAAHSTQEWRFIVAHETLHAALAHHTRAGGRDHWLFNIACDFVINGWLVEMAVGELPADGLYDPGFAGLGAEEVYDRIAAQARRYRKLATLRGRPGAAGDVEVGLRGRPTDGVAGVDLDELLRRGLVQGLALHESAGRGLLPAGLVAEIRARAQPPPAWDVALARWFDEYFPAVEPMRSYARPSRRQSATPEIPRPGRRHPDDPVTRRTFGVVLDTSGSMAPELLGKALGAIASYATVRDVPAARVVFCDAAAYDAGYLAPADIAGRVRVRGRGGTVLQPGVTLLERADDFPPDGPILVITDGSCDPVRIRRAHAFLIPAGATLPMRPHGPVFRIR